MAIMATRQVENVLHHVRQVLAQHGARQQSDRELLRHFAQRRDEQAFAELVRRHGPMVLAVCRRVLHDLHDAEDAFQAVFLILARKANARGWCESVANWLYLVAYRLAARLRKDRQRDRLEMPPIQAVSVDLLEAVSGRELCAAVDEELSRMPERLRAGIVLCCLQGATRDEAVRQLGWSLGTLKRRLEQGRASLRVRLRKRGFELPAALAGALVAEGVSNAAVPSALLQAAITTATTGAAASASVVALAETFLSGVLFSRLRVAAVLLLAASLVGGLGLAVGIQKSPVGPQQSAEKAQQKAEGQQPGADQYGDPLPPGAVARMGTIRLRHSGFPSAAVFTQDGKAVISAGVDGVINMWDAVTGKRLQQLSIKAPLGPLVMSPDGKTIAVGDWRGEGIRLIDTASFQQVRFWKGHNGRDISVDFAPDGRSLLSAATTEDAEIILWNPDTGERLRAWQAHKGGVRAPRFSPDGKTIASSGSDNTLAVWDAATGRELWRQTMADNNPHGICFAPDGKTLFAGGSGENHVTVWEAATGKLVRRFEAAKGGHLVLAITPDGKTLAATDSWGACRLWDVASGKPLRSLEGCREQLIALAFSPDGKTLVATSRDESVHFWDVETGKERHVFPAHVYLLTSTVFTADGKGLFTCGFDGTVRHWDAETGRHLRQLAKADEFVMQLALSPDGTTLAAGTSANFNKMRLRDGAHLVRLWDLKSG
jgi:RNA polymerase sigma factor (sigma-70 family)